MNSDLAVGSALRGVPGLFTYQIDGKRLWGGRFTPSTGTRIRYLLKRLIHGKHPSPYSQPTSRLDGATTLRPLLPRALPANLDEKGRAPAHSTPCLAFGAMPPALGRAIRQEARLANHARIWKRP